MVSYSRMQSQNGILVIDDDNFGRADLVSRLEQAGHLVKVFDYEEPLLECLAEGDFGLIFLNLDLPQTNGIELMYKVRQRQPEAQMIALSSKIDLQSVVRAMRSGAIDYFLKPVDPEHALRRVSEILNAGRVQKRRREIILQMHRLIAELRQLSQAELGEASKVSSGPLLAGRLSLHPKTSLAYVDDRPVYLAPVTFTYLTALARHAPEPVSHENLVREAQGYVVSRFEARELTRWHIHELRRAIEPNPQKPRYIISVWDFGYRLAT